MTSKSKNDYDVGYGKPPKHTRFRKGQSGNPKGRPKGAEGIRGIVKRQGDVRHLVPVNGEKQWLNRREISVVRLWGHAMNGDLKTFQALLEMEKPPVPTGKQLFDPEQMEIEVTLVLEENDPPARPDNEDPEDSG